MKTRKYTIQFHAVVEFPDGDTPNAAVVAGAVKSMLRFDGCSRETPLLIGGVHITGIKCDGSVIARAENNWEASEE